MDKQRIINAATNIFGSLDSVGTDLYKGTLKVKDKQAGIYYIDVSGNLAEDFDQYQENILAKDYYNNPGSIQWNYYLLLLQDKDKQNSQQKLTLEKNSKYARKFIFNENEFEDFFKLEKSSQAIDTNLILEWKTKLDNVDLQEVYGTESYVSIMARFEANKTIKLKLGNSFKKSTSPSTNIQKISRLRLYPEYRPYPLQRTYKFGSVNLIKGINGVGKTSLFEAIEMMICGRSLRNPDKREPNGCVEANFNDAATPVKLDSSQGGNDTYRSRDLAWYSNTYIRDSQLHVSFNRYNFFNADAAYRFANSSSEEEVRKALNNIILGPEYDHITERMQKVYERLRPVYTRLTADQKQAVADALAANNDIKKIKKNNDLSQLKNLLRQSIEQVGFISTFEDVELDLIPVEQTNNEVQTLVSNIEKEELLDTLSALNKRLQEFNKKTELFKIFEENIRVISSDRAEIEKTIEALQRKVILFTDAKKYFADPQLFLLEGLSEKINLLDTAVKRIEHIITTLAGIELISFASPKTIEAALATIAQDKVTAEQELAEEERKQKAQLERLNKTDQLIREIKTLGAQFLTLDPDIHACPLCQTDFDRSELETKIGLIIESADAATDDDFLKITEKINALKNALAAIDTKRTSLQAIKTVAERVEGISKEAIEQKSITELITIVTNTIKSIDKAKEQYDQLLSLQQFVKSFEVSETEFKTIKEKAAAEEMGNLSFIYDNKLLFESALVMAQGSIEKGKANYDTLTEKRAASATEFKTALGLPLESTFQIGEIQEILGREELKLNGLKDCFEKLQILVKLADDTSIKAVGMNAELLQKNIQTFHNEVRSQVELSVAEKKLTDANKTIETTKLSLTRYQPACDTLKSLVEDNGNKELNHFFNGNLVEILDVFKNIHTPKEFHDIKLADGKLLLITEKDEERKITEISTGQRSALVLSIFITLNRKLKSGPNIILFDDPISFIDDLNALSFLDFLRQFILKEGKQIFFATANARLATLFEKKFSFLGEEDFKTWELVR